MATITIEDLPSDKKISPEEMKAILGGGVEPLPFRQRLTEFDDEGGRIRPPGQMVYDRPIKFGI